MTSSCTNWRDCGIIGGGCCAINAHNGPSFGVCMQCDKYEGPPRGRGDAIHKITTLTGIKAAVDTVSAVTGWDCGCEAKRQRLNREHSYQLNSV